MDTMEKRVRISLKATQKQYKEAPVTTEFVTFGVLSRYGTKYRISYEESELFGQPGVTTTFITDRGKVSLERSGSVNALMEFHPGEVTESMYDTSFGTLLMQIKAKTVEENVGENGGTIRLEYELSLSHLYIALNSFRVQIDIPD